MASLRNYKPNDAFLREFAVGPELKGIVLSVAEDAKVVAETLSAGVVSDEDHPHYRDSFEASTVEIDWQGEHPGPRVAGRLANTSDHAAPVEWGYRGRAEAPNEKNAHRILGRTLDMLGGLPAGQPE